MKKRIWRLIAEIGFILAISLVVSLCVNLFRNNGLPLTRAYVPTETGPAMNLAEIDLDTLKALMDGGMVVLLDARAADVYRSGHIPGALSLPLGEKRLIYPGVKEILESGDTIVIYCIDSGCLDSSFLAEWLAARGHSDIMVFREGMEGWRNSGNTVERSR